MASALAAPFEFSVLECLLFSRRKGGDNKAAANLPLVVDSFGKGQPAMYVLFTEVCTIQVHVKYLYISMNG